MVFQAKMLFVKQRLDVDFFEIRGLILKCSIAIEIFQITLKASLTNACNENLWY